jgi:hypothetical protein
MFRNTLTPEQRVRVAIPGQAQELKDFVHARKTTKALIHHG